jgi:hypothetical protein
MMHQAFTIMTARADAIPAEAKYPGRRRKVLCTLYLCMVAKDVLVVTSDYQSKQGSVSSQKSCRCLHLLFRALRPGELIDMHMLAMMT